MTPFKAVFFLLFFFVSLSASRVFALTTIESFTSVSNKEDSTAVWNIARGELHPPLRAFQLNRGFGLENYSFSIGDGSDGDFLTPSDSSRFSCITSAGTYLYVDTDACSEFNFRNFRLPSGWTLYPTGDAPFILRAQGFVQIDGTIDCSGGAGASANSSLTLSRTGGAGRCGGGDGGGSVLPLQAPAISNRGQSGGGTTTGGSGGGVQSGAGGEGGGGGGAFVKTFAGGTDDPNGTSGLNTLSASTGNVGTNFRDDAFVDVPSGGGSGGGGGSGFQSGADPGNSSGGGGGAGGGTIRIFAGGDITITGSVLARGGAGGSASAPFKGGAGGGGGGGSIQIMTVGDILNNGTISAVPGAGGTAASNADGGNGFYGRTWVLEKDVYADGNYEAPESRLVNPGVVEYETGITYTVRSKAIDLRNSIPDNLIVSQTIEDQAGATFNLTTDHTGRFIDFEMTFDNTDGVNPIRVTEVRFDYTGFTQDEFEFTGSCARVEGFGSGITPLHLVLWLSPLMFAFGLRFKTRNRFRNSV